MSFDLMSLLTFGYDILMSIKHLSYSVMELLLTDISFFGQPVDLIYVLFGGGLITFLIVKITAELIS